MTTFEALAIGTISSMIGTLIGLLIVWCKERKKTKE